MIRLASALVTLAIPAALAVAVVVPAERARRADRAWAAYLEGLPAEAPACARSKRGPGCVCADFTRLADAAAYVAATGGGEAAAFGLVFDADGRLCPHLP